MNIDQATLDFLRKQHIHFLLPMYGGQCNEATFISMIKFAIMAQKIGLNYSIDTMVNESLIPRGRNNLTAKMLFNQDATHLFFIDVDLRFDPEAILKLICHNADVVGGVYPMKRLPVKYVINTVPNPIHIPERKLVEVSTLGTGFICVKRGVLDKMIEAHPELKYNDNVGIGAQYEPLMYGLWDTMIDEHKNYLSEDWTFCYLWRKMGGRVFADYSIRLDHTGYHTYEGNPEELEKVLLGQIHNGGDAPAPLPEALVPTVAEVPAQEEAVAEPVETAAPKKIAKKRK